jgi:AcrR family transcriptional regulator
MSSRTASAVSPARRTLTHAVVVKAALAYVDEHGLEELGMNKLGAELGVKGMSLYNHVGGKDDLLDGIVELLWAEIESAADPPHDWQEAARVLVRALRETVRRHPAAARLLMSRQVMPVAALRTCDTYLRVMREEGLPEECAVPFLRAIVAYGLGQALSELSYFSFAFTAEEDDLRRLRRLSALIPDDAPDHLVRVALQVCGGCDPDEQHALGIDLMVRGLAQHLAENVAGG